MTAAPVAAGLLAAGAAGLVVAAVLTARPPSGDLPDRDRYVEAWARLHGGYDPRRASAWVRGWLALVLAVARPLARRGVHPDVVTLASVWAAAALLLPVAAGGAWPLAGALLLVLSGLFDALDGSVAVLQERTTRWGYVLDSVVDRVSDALHLVALVLLGAPGALAVAAGGAAFLLEYTRARAGNAGGDDVVAITVAERPVRVLVVVATVLACGAAPAVAPELATAGAAVLCGLVAVGLGQLLVAVRRSPAGTTRLSAEG